MCEDEGTRGGVGIAEAARCGIGGKGRGGLWEWFQWVGGRTVTNKVGGGDDRDSRESSLWSGRKLVGRGHGGRRRDGRRWKRWHQERRRQERKITRRHDGKVTC